MADQLTEFAKLANDEIERGIYENIITNDNLMPLLKFRQINGNAYVYNRESTLPGSFVYQFGGTVSTTKSTFTKRQVALTTLMAQTDMDMYISDTRDNVQDPDAINLAALTKSLTREIARQVIQGNSGSSTGEGTQGVEFEGLTSLIDAESRWRGMDNLATALSATPGAAETTLTVAGLDLILDDLDDGRSSPDGLILNTTMRRKISVLARAATNGIVLNDAEMFGHQYRMFNGIPLIITNFITDSEQYEAAGTWPSSTATTIFAIHFGEDKQGHTMVHNGPVMKPRVLDLAVPVDEHNKYTRMYVYTNAMVYSSLHVVGLGGIDSAS
jgi:hypothetical protein